MILLRFRPAKAPTRFHFSCRGLLGRAVELVAWCKNEHLSCGGQIVDSLEGQAPRVLVSTGPRLCEPPASAGRTLGYRLEERAYLC